ncbi:MAG: hypothetical protein F6K23_39430 [Okeania sp. SIO2C9]|uniref:hypothetical protein n=1 Tax=Okeania sp. SIO2C9 TaxID=2607791 RepID=UPI0013C1FBD9|nr:hypothetical protein [Okeania sp. SIO2C9]NEQ78536.1 hypothetical protein [Okeania sp. SIO2C9]
MKKSILLISLILLPLSLIAAQSGTGSTLYHEINARLMVKDRRIAGDRLSAWCENLGGYYTVKSQDHLSLRLPAEKLEELTAVLEAESSEVLDYSRNAFDLKEDLMMSASALEAREELLERNLGRRLRRRLFRTPRK